MSFIIACILITGFELKGTWYLVALAFWIGHLMYYSD